MITPQRPVYDLAIVGSGVAGMFAATKIAKEHPNVKTILIEIGREPQKRRMQLMGYGGLIANSDGKLYLNDLENTSKIIGQRKFNNCNKWFRDFVGDTINLNITKDVNPGKSAQNKIKKSGFEIKLNNYIQIFPKEIHLLLRKTSNLILEAKNIDVSFNNEVFDIFKNKNQFVLDTELGEFKAKKVLLCVGRSGWRWVKSFYEKFELLKDNNIARFGIRAEIDEGNMDNFNKSNCTIYNDKLEIGPLSWNGTVIPEDHYDMAISSFRSNENRWASDKVSFNIIGNRVFENKGFEQTERIAQLTFVLTNDRISKEKISSILLKRSKISIIQEYDWLKESLQEIEGFIPEIINKGYFHVPTIIPSIPKIDISNNLETNVEGLYCAGESAGVIGLLSAALTGISAADSICK